MSDIVTKWGIGVGERGFAQVPNYLLLLNQFLDKDTRLSPVELLVLIQLVGTWWKKEEQPFPSLATLAIRCGVSERQAQRAVNRLVEIDLIRRTKRRIRGIISSNSYDLSPLVEVLTALAQAFPNEFPRRLDRTTATSIGQYVTGPKGPDRDLALPPWSAPGPFGPHPEPKPISGPTGPTKPKP